MFSSRVFIAFCTVCLSISSYSQSIAIVKIDDLKELMENSTNQIRVINFWATWCSPCVEELPYFEKANEQKGVEVILVSLDFVENLSKVNTFVMENSLQSKVVLLDEIDYNAWINKVNSNWSGAIPATLIVAPKATCQKFIEGELTQDKLNRIINQVEENKDKRTKAAKQK